MKKTLLVILVLCITVAACRKDNTKDSTMVTPSTTNGNNGTTQQTAARLPMGMAGGVSSQFIPVNVANEMINSYLNSINYTMNDTDIRSFSVNADSLRALLANTSIKNVKLVFAHTMNYINAGYAGVPAGYQAGAMTIIIAGYDVSGNYVFYNGSSVLDHLTPCPYSCIAGSAGNPLF